MSVIHIVAFKTPSNTTEALTSAFLKLKDECQRDGKPYIKAVKGGKQISSEAFHHDMKVVFIMEFEKQEDLAFYLNRDEAHDQFKKKVRAEWACEGVVALDFVDGAYD